MRPGSPCPVCGPDNLLVVRDGHHMCDWCGHGEVSDDRVVSDVRFVPAGAAAVRTGLLAWASCTCAGLRIDGLAVRRTRQGLLVVTFPARLDGRGARHPIVTPLDPGVRRRIVEEILEAFRGRTGVAS